MSDQARARAVAEERFAVVFAHLGLVADYARRRGVVDPEGVAAEVMAIAWRRLADVPVDDPRPWLIATARNLVWADWRRQRGGGDSLDRGTKRHSGHPVADYRARPRAGSRADAAVGE